MSADHLRELIDKYQNIVSNLNTSIDTLTQAEHIRMIAKANVAKNTHLKNLIQEEIMSEKALMKATN